MEIVKYALAFAWFAWPYAAVGYATRYLFPKMPPFWLILITIVGGLCVYFVVMALLFSFTPDD
jgi:hypothetical protein